MALLLGMSGLAVGAGPADAAPLKDPEPKASDSKSSKKKTKKKAKPRATKPDCGRAEAGAADSIPGVPWQQKWLSPERLGPLATGYGQVVAVVDSGVNDEHEQLKGHVQSGYDTVRGTLGGNEDCVSHGSGVAGLIVAAKVGSVGLRGIAPGAQIMPVRVTNAAPASGPDSSEKTTPAKVAAGIRWAAKNGATVIEVSSAFGYDGGLCGATKYAVGKGIPVVAAVGDLHDATLSVDPATYPAACDDVIGVGSVSENFTVSSSSVANGTVDLVAPGDGVISTNRIAGQQSYDGTSLAAGLVAGAAALVRQTGPGLTPGQIADRLAATADPVPGGQLSISYGAGLVNPYRALTERAAAAAPVHIDGVAAPTVDVVAERIESARDHGRVTAVAVATGVLGTALLLVVLALCLPRGRGRGWKPGRAAPVRSTPAQPVLPDEESPFALPEAQRG
ncbi:S8 family serine peptidase [Kineosporia sp. J2-2]|uniref:S8 family serine peptidase n=1 Tax=Kineosporia corallincola TaxID=2835133 RepID=A0ABS5TAN2_9ACTN|nr:S8 family serine peptidase [Kineosporia corallincola]MBT0768123.1 S8 family serine peptidase [Kineosporia corallincola]